MSKLTTVRGSKGKQFRWRGKILDRGRKLGSGCSTTAWAVKGNRKMVLKEGCEAANLAHYLIFKALHGKVNQKYVPIVYGISSDYSWILTERVTPLDHPKYDGQHDWYNSYDHDVLDELSIPHHFNMEDNWEGNFGVRADGTYVIIDFGAEHKLARQVLVGERMKHREYLKELKAMR